MRRSTRKRSSKLRFSKKRSPNLIVIAAIVLVISAMALYLNGAGRKRGYNRPSPSATNIATVTLALTPTSRIRSRQAPAVTRTPTRKAVVSRTPTRRSVATRTPTRTAVVTPTPAPTAAATTRPRSTPVPTSRPTSTQAPTQALTQALTQAPTQVPTRVPTLFPTVTMTQAATPTATITATAIERNSVLSGRDMGFTQGCAPILPITVGIELTAKAEVPKR